MTGEYQHTMDTKGRLFVPARLREDLGENFMVTKGLDNCLFVYSMDNWKTIEERINSMPLSKSRNMQRTFFASAAKCSVDAQGRILIPQKLRDYAHLSKDVTVIGVSNRAEIWNTDSWREIEESDLTAENLAESMDELGF